MKKTIRGGKVEPKEGGASKQGDKGHAKSRYANERGVHPTSAAASKHNQGMSTRSLHNIKVDVLMYLKTMPKLKLY